MATEITNIAPFHEVTVKEFRLMTKPWITREILAKCDSRDALLKEIKTETDPIKLQSLYTEYKRLRNQITSEKRDGKKKFQIAQFEQNKNKSSDVWKNIRALVNIKPSKSTNIKGGPSVSTVSASPRLVQVTIPKEFCFPETASFFPRRTRFFNFLFFYYASLQ